MCHFLTMRARNIQRMSGELGRCQMNASQPMVVHVRFLFSIAFSTVDDSVAVLDCVDCVDRVAFFVRYDISILSTQLELPMVVRLTL